jgi:hypothetical protein
MTGVVPGFGAGAGTVMSGAISDGGRMTPPVLSSLSLRDWGDEPTVPVDR